MTITAVMQTTYTDCLKKKKKKNQHPMQSHNAKTTQSLQKLKSWWVTQIYRSKEPIRLVTNIYLLMRCVITLPPSPVVSQAALPWPHLCCKTCCSSSLPAGCFPPSIWARLSKAARFVPCLSLQWGARCLKKLLQPCMCRTPMWPKRTSQTSSVPMTPS